MGTVLYTLLGFVALLFLAGTALRIRKLRRDKRLRESIGVDPRPRITPVPAPEGAKSFRFLRENEEPSETIIELPRIEPVRRRIFEDGEDREDFYPQPAKRGRHDNDWLLDRSRHRSDPLRLVKVLILVVVLLAAGSGVAYYVLHQHSTHH